MDTPPRLHPLRNHPAPGGSLDRRCSGQGDAADTNRTKTQADAPPSAEPTLTVDYLVGLAMEAHDRVYGSRGFQRGLFEKEARERAAQAACVHRLELDLAREESRS